MFKLESELKKYIPYDENEKKSVESLLKFLEGDNCFDRSNLKGHVTAGAFVCDRLGNILLNHHKASNMWFQFGGHCDGEGNCLNVAKREIMEEANITNFTLDINSIFDVNVVKVPLNSKKNEPEHLHYDVNFMFIVDNHNFNISDESTEIKWVTIDEALKLVDKKDIGMIRMIKKYEDYLKNFNLIIK